MLNKLALLTKLIVHLNHKNSRTVKPALMIHKLLLGSALLALAGTAKSQLYIESGATFFIDNGAVVTVQGDLTTNASIQVNGAAGTGKIRMGGSALQNISLNGFTVPNLQIDNAANVAMLSAGKVSNTLEFTTGKLQLGNFNLSLTPTGTFTGAGAGKFAETNGTGLFQKEVTAAGSYILPVGNGSNYSPLSYTLTGGTYGAGALVAARSVGAGHPQKHVRSTDYLNSYWALANSGITGSSIAATGTYVDPAGVTGTEADVRSFVWNGTAWVAGTSNDATANTVTAAVTTATNELYAMNKFILNSPKVFLQGAYNSGTGLMSDALRTSPALIPTSDPYRTAPYNTLFTHVNNSVAESINPALLNNNANPNDDIVDWIFVELRSITSGTVAPVAQTRSVLVQRDGDVVDVDGVSPVYFKNVDPGNYAVSIRHRNHLGLSTNPAVPVAIGLASSTLNFTTLAAGSLFGTANATYVNTGTVNLLYSGNANFNTNVRYGGPANDKDYILGTLLSSNSGTVLNNVYSQGDLNMNRVVRYGGPNNDKDFLLATPLASNGATVRNQSLPN